MKTWKTHIGFGRVFPSNPYANNSKGPGSDFLQVLGAEKGFLTALKRIRQLKCIGLVTNVGDPEREFWDFREFGSTFSPTVLMLLKHHLRATNGLCTQRKSESMCDSWSACSVACARGMILKPCSEKHAASCNPNASDGKFSSPCL